MRSLLLIPWFLALGSCGSPPKPPAVDESNRRPANMAQAVELQTCKSDLQNTRLQAAESSRLAQVAARNADALRERQQALAALMPPPGTRAAASANEVFTVHFRFGSAALDVPPALAEPLLTAARSAPLVMLRGRTDGNADTVVESRIARLRAVAVRDYLVAAGVDPARIRATHQPTGDHVADNATAAGRGQNRRVEIEVYAAAPADFASAAPATRQP